MRLVIMVLAIWLYAQFNVLEQKLALPESVETAFMAKYPQAEDIEWDEHNGVYEIEFMLEGMVQCEYFHPGTGFIRQDGVVVEQPKRHECDTSCFIQ